jgi:CheY-like chemotaxis protein
MMGEREKNPMDPPAEYDDDVIAIFNGKNSASELGH